MIRLCLWDVRTSSCRTFEMFSTALEWVAKKHLPIPYLIQGKGKTRKRKNGKGKAEKRVKGRKAGKRVKGGKAEKRVKSGKRIKGGKARKG